MPVSPFRIDDGLTEKQARKYVKRLAATWDRARSRADRHLYYVASTGTWIVYARSTTVTERFALSFYHACPCGAAT